MLGSSLILLTLMEDWRFLRNTRLFCHCQILLFPGSRQSHGRVRRATWHDFRGCNPECNTTWHYEKIGPRP